jgi:capsular exopolysaccharide synthesis family protein
MSRIDQAWRQAADPLIHDPEIASRGEDPSEALLHQYPGEAGPSRTPAAPSRPPAEPPAPLPFRTVAAPRTAERGQFAPLHTAYERKLVVSGKASPLAVVQYRQLAAALQDLQAERGLKTLMVTSALPNDGRTLTAANIALTLSEAGARRVLLIDADVRRPSLHTLFRLPNACGLSDVLLSEHDDLALLQVSANLSVLPSGRPDLNTIAALTSDRMEDLLEHLSGEFDWILLDAAPVWFMPDAQLLARMTGAVLFVIGAGSTPYPLVEKAIAAVGADSVVGTVLNRVVDENIPAAGYATD